MNNKEGVLCPNSSPCHNIKRGRLDRTFHSYSTSPWGKSSISSYGYPLPKMRREFFWKQLKRVKGEKALLLAKIVKSEGSFIKSWGSWDWGGGIWKCFSCIILLGYCHFDRACGFIELYKIIVLSWILPTIGVFLVILGGIH